MARCEDLSSADLLVEYDDDGDITSIHERGGKPLGFVLSKAGKVAKGLDLFTEGYLIDESMLFNKASAISTVPLAYDYFVSTTGSDSADGLSPTTPWATLSKINSVALSAGQKKSVLVKAGTYSSALDYIALKKDNISGAMLTIVFEPGVTMDGTLANPASGSNVGAIELSGNKPWTAIIYGNGLKINNYHDTGAGTNPNGVGSRGYVTAHAYNITTTNCDDGFSAHENSNLYLYDCAASGSEKGAFNHVDNAYAEAHRCTFSGGGSMGIGGVAGANVVQKLYECWLIPTVADDPFDASNTEFVRCRVGTLTTRMRLKTTYSGAAKFDSCFINVWNDGSVNAEYEMCFGLFTVRARPGAGISMMHSVIVGPATGKSGVLISDTDFGASAPIRLNDNAFVGSMTFDSLTNATYASRLFNGVDSQLKNNVLYGGAAYSAILTAADSTAGGGHIVGTQANNPGISGAATYTMSDYAVTAEVSGSGFSMGNAA